MTDVEWRWAPQGDRLSKGHHYAESDNETDLNLAPGTRYRFRGKSPD